ncbi:hypothetical protein DMA12_40370 [Amycolatopsis balhimycina DSM 5908]|uniref:Uncharacterized protein n=1 Tax=Amycolatopsis balhimycina DSM 5908 TaxID=1081091 RepID=A0A428W088_AMYBA|nr:DUF6461 domain-containing protein [Amycolatopsis balhimycina]RSM36478.1 hypothetical protein DMA12_40370 [Amycolatopsis balhimycina DSM 5908]
MTGDDFDWLSTSTLGEAACVTMVKTTDVDAVVRDFGGVTSEARTVPFAATGNDLDQAYTVAVCRQGEYVVAIETNGFQGTRPEVLRRVSQLGETVSAFWNIEALTRFSYAVDGRIKTAFEAGADSWKDGEDPDCLTPLAADIDWAASHWRTGLLLLAARLTGQPFTEDWLDGDALVAPIAEHLEDVHPVTPGFEPLEYQHPVLAAALRRADNEPLLTVAHAAVDEVLASAGLTEVPDSGTEFDELVRMARYEAGYAPDADRLRLLALDAVRTLRTAPNPLTAAFKTIYAAILAKQLDRHDPAPLLAGFLDLLGNPPAPSGADGARAGTGGPLQRHAWITEHWLGLAASITYARSTPLDTVAAAFGGIEFGAGPVSLTDTEQVALRREDDWTIAIAFNRSPFAHQIVEALRPHTTVLNVGWETRGNKLAYFAQPGHDVVVIRPGQGAVPAPLASYTTSLPAPAGNATPWLLALGEAVTGITFTPEGLDAQHTLLRLG